MKVLEEISTQGMSNPGLQYQVLNMAFLPSEIEDVKKVMDNIVKEVRNNETFMARFKDYDKYLDTLNDVADGMRIKNTAVAFIALLNIVQNHMEDLKAGWIEGAKDKDYVPLSSIIGRSNVKAADGRIIDRAVEKLISQGKIDKKEKEKALLYLAEEYLGIEHTVKPKKKPKKK